MITTNLKDYQLQVPRFLLVLALPALGLLGIALGISSAIEKPYIGVWLDGESKSGWVIREIDEDRVTLLEHVNDGVSYRTGSVNVTDLLMVDDVIVAIHGLDKVIRWQFSPLDPDTLATYAEYNDFFKVQGELFDILKSGKVGLEKANGGIVWLQVFPDRPLTSLPFVFWSNCVFALAALIIGSLVSSYGLHTVPAPIAAPWSIATVSCAKY